jgi:predicted alternative tryptophan synthase beta-subunit
VFEAAVTFARAEGILPAPESAHAIRTAIDEALLAKETGEKKVILFNLSGHGHFDLVSYNKYLSGSLEDYVYPEESRESISAHLPVIEDLLTV